MTPQKHKDETLRTLGRSHRSGRAQATQRDAVRGCALGRSHHARSARPADRPGENHPAADRAHPSARVPVALVRARTCQRTEPVQAHPGAEQRRSYPSLPAARRCPQTLLEQILAKTDGVPLFVEELTKSILESGRAQGGRRSLRLQSALPTPSPSRPRCRDSLMARLDRFMPVKEIAQIGAAIGREFSYELIAAVAPMAQGPTRRRTGAADRVGTGVSKRHTAGCHLHLQARPGAGRSLRLAAQEPQTGVARKDRARDRGALPEHQEHRARGAGPSPHRCGPR